MTTDPSEGPLATLTPESNEFLLGRSPIVVRRRVLWSECDPARVVYTGRFFDYAAACYGWFARHVLQTAGGGSLAALGLNTPIRAISFEFEKMLRPDDWFDMRLSVTDVRTRTFDIRIDATTADGGVIFIGRLTPIIVSDATKHSAAIPEPVRIAMDRYRTLS